MGLCDLKRMFAGKIHLHDDRYYTETEVDGLLSGKSDTGHDHNDQYYTETEVDGLLSGKADIGHSHGGGGGSSREIGEIIMWSTDTAPSSWLLCAGSEYSETTYSNLYAVIGDTFNTGGETAGYFRVPDMRGRFPLGQDDMGGSSANRVTDSEADSLGGSEGFETHTLITSEIPSHRHYTSDNAGYALGPYALQWHYGKAYTNGGNYSDYVGGDSPHNNMPPYFTINYCIYAGA